MAAVGRVFSILRREKWTLAAKERDGRKVTKRESEEEVCFGDIEQRFLLTVYWPSS